MYCEKDYCSLSGFFCPKRTDNVRCDISTKRFSLKIFLNLCNHFIVYFNIKCKGYVLHIFLSDWFMFRGNLTEAKKLLEAFEHYKEWHPHSALGYRSPKEYLRGRASNGLSDNWCLEIQGQIH